MKKLIVAMLLIICVTVVKAGDKEDFIKERQELVNRIKEYDQVIQNLKYRIAQLDALIQYVQKQETEKNDKKKKKDKK